MINTPKSLRLQIALLGRTNVGKSSFLNLIANQEVSIVSPVVGTTTNIVEKPTELLPIGPVTFLGTGVLECVLSPFLDILNEYRRILDSHKKVVNL